MAFLHTAEVVKRICVPHIAYRFTADLWPRSLRPNANGRLFCDFTRSAFCHVRDSLPTASAASAAALSLSPVRSVCSGTACCSAPVTSRLRQWRSLEVSTGCSPATSGALQRAARQATRRSTRMGTLPCYGYAYTPVRRSGKPKALRRAAYKYVPVDIARLRAQLRARRVGTRRVDLRVVAPAPAALGRCQRAPTSTERYVPVADFSRRHFPARSSDPTGRRGTRARVCSPGRTARVPFDADETVGPSTCVLTTTRYRRTVSRCTKRLIVLKVRTGSLHPKRGRHGMQGEFAQNGLSQLTSGMSCACPACRIAVVCSPPLSGI